VTEDRVSGKGGEASGESCGEEWIKVQQNSCWGRGGESTGSGRREGVVGESKGGQPGGSKRIVREMRTREKRRGCPTPIRFEHRRGKTWGGGWSQRGGKVGRKPLREKSKKNAKGEPLVQQRVRGQPR